jgi:hypothetical protein
MKSLNFLHDVAMNFFTVSIEKGWNIFFRKAVASPHMLVVDGAEMAVSVA